jgi:hypothetical protein
MLVPFWALWRRHLSFASVTVIQPVPQSLKAKYLWVVDTLFIAHFVCYEIAVLSGLRMFVNMTFVCINERQGYPCDRFIYCDIDRCRVIKSPLLIIYGGSLIRAVGSVLAFCITLNHPAVQSFDQVSATNDYMHTAAVYHSLPLVLCSANSGLGG